MSLIEEAYHPSPSLSPNDRSISVQCTLVSAVTKPVRQTGWGCLTRWGDRQRVRWRSSRGCLSQADVRIQCFHLEPEDHIQLHWKKWIKTLFKRQKPSKILCISLLECIFLASFAFNFGWFILLLTFNSSIMYLWLLVILHSHSALNVVTGWTQIHC